MKNKVTDLLLFIGLLTLFSNFKISAGNLGGAGSTYRAYQPFHNVFRDQQSAWGGVRMANGFSIVTPASGVGSTHGSSAYLDTCLSVSGYIDLRETNTMILRADLKLDSGASFSSSGRIYGRDVSLVLNGNLNLPSNIVLHFGGNLAIEGNGNTLNLGENSQIFVDTDATLTLRNLIVSNRKNFAGNPAIKLASSGSQLALDNSILDLTGDFYFDRGSLFVHNDVVFTGTNAFIYRSCQPSFIKSGATLNFDVGTTFDFRPSCTGTPSLQAKDLISMEDATSQLYLNGCTLKTTLTGLRLKTGQLLLDNRVSVTSQAALKFVDFYTTVTSWIYGNKANIVDWHPSGKYLVVGGINGFYSLSLFDVNGNRLSWLAIGVPYYSAKWSPDGKYVLVGSSSNVYVFEFDGSNLWYLNQSSSTGGAVFGIAWSPDGKFFAIGAGAGGIKLYSFNGVSFVQIGSTISLGTSVQSVDWSPDGRYLAAVSNSAGTNLAIYRFTGTSLISSPVVSRNTGASNMYGISWSPDGRFLAVGVGTSTLQVLSFDGTNLGTVAQVTEAINLYNPVWSPDGRYISYIGTSSYIYKLENKTLTRVASKSIFSSLTSYIGAAWSPDQKYLAVAGENPIAPYLEFSIFNLAYGPETQTQALSNSIVFGNSALGSNYDLNVRVLAGSQVSVDGLVNFDNVN